MRKTRLSLYYLAGYLVPTGALFLAAPDLAFRLLLSNGSYGDVLPRMLGGLILALGIIVVQIIRLRAEALYSTTLVVRLFLAATMIGVYAYSGDPFFLMVLGVVGLGIALTGTSWLLERRAAAPQAR